MKKIVFTFGRMNPPTIGHAKLVDKVQSVAKSEKADARVYLSHTSVQDDPKNKKDPLNYKQKIKYAKKAFGSVMQESNSKTLIQILKELEQDGYTDVVAVFGGDRIREMETLIKKYNGKDYNFDSIKVVSAGERDPDSTDPSVKKKKKHVTKVSEMSASAMRELAKEGQLDDYEEDGKKYIGFRKGLPKRLQGSAEAVMKDVVSNLSEEVEMEEQRAPLTIAQRQAKARQMKRLAPRLARFRKMKAKRMADREQILKRAQKAARNVIRKKIAGERGADYSALSASEKITIDKMVAKKSAVIQKLAKKLLPKVRKAEIERLKQARSAKNEEVQDWTDADFNALVEETFMMIEKDERKKEVAQDSDVKDMEGTQPKKYYKGLSDKEKESRAKQFAKGADKPDSDPASYKPAPGDDDAKTKPSKHTLKYKKMFGEGAVEDTRERHKQEKEELKRQHDAEMDDARLQDTRDKNAQTEEYELSEDATASLKKKSEKSGIPLGILRQVYNRGMAAWKTGHRLGATQQQWGFARVNSFITKGKGTWGKADSDLAAKVRGTKKEEVSLDEKRKPLEIGMKNALEPDEVVKGIGASRYSEIMALGSKDKGQYHFFDDEDHAKAAQKKHGGRIEKVRGRMGNDFYILRGANILKAQYEEVELDEARAKKAVASGKVQKLITGFGMTYKGKKYDEIDFERVSIDNSSQIVTLKILHPREHIGDEVKVPFKTLRVGRFMATDTSKINEAVSPAQQAAIAISKKERGEKPKKEEQFEPHMMYDPESGDKELAKVPADHDRLAKKGWVHEPPKKKKLKAMLSVPTARPPSQMGEETELEEMPRWLLEPLSKITNKKGYDAAKKVLADVLARKKKEAGRKGLQHSIEYYAAQIAKQFQGVDARVLADMVTEEPEKMDAPQIGTDKIKKRYADMTPRQISESFQTPKSAGTGHTMFATEFMKIQGAYEHHPDVEEELERRESSKKSQISEAIEYHAENGLSIKENIFRPHSDAYYAFFRECRRLYESGELEITDGFDRTLMESDAGLVGIYEGQEVPLDLPLIAEEEKKELNKPMRGGPKKFYVFVKDPSTGNIKKVTFGDTTGLKVKLDDPEARKSFAARHQCDQQKDKTKASYWSCRLPYYAKELGLSGGGSFFW